MAGKDQETEQVFEEMLAAYRPLFPPDSLSSAWIQLAYGMWLRQRGRDQKSGPYFQEAIRIYRGHPNPPREMYLAAVDGLFQLMRKREEGVGETISLFHEAMENMAYLYGPDHLLLAPHLLGFAKELEARDRAVEAIPLVIEGIRIHRKAKGDDWDATPSLQMLDRFVRRVVLAPGLTEDKCQAAAKGAEALLSEKPAEASYRNLLGMAQYRLGLFDEALKNLEQTAEGASRQDAEHSQHRLGFLAMTHRRLGNAAKSNSALGELRERMAQSSDTPTKDARVVLSEAEAMISDKASSGPMAVIEPE
jgi:tetratricopeptide (TPR) repeat protein